MKVFRKLFSKKTKLIILNSPSNPTGRVMPMRDLEKISEMVKDTATWVITDEMYAKIVYNRIKYPSFYSFSKINPNTILVDGFSKVYSMTGWRIGYIAAPLNLTKKLDSLITHLTGSTATFTQYAALEGLNGPQKSVEVMVKSFGKSSEYIADFLLKKAGVAVLDGKFFGEYGEGYLRISYATSMENIKEGLERIQSALTKLKKK